MMQHPLFPPIGFGVVEDGLFRSGVPDAINYEFLKGLRLKTVVILSPNAVDDNFLKFLEGECIEVCNVGRVMGDAVIQGLYPLTEEMVTDSLKIIAKGSSYPILLVCKSGKALSGVVVACLRKLQKWSMVSIFEEYRRYSGGSRLQPQQEQFIEIYDTDLIEISVESPEFLHR